MGSLAQLAVAKGYRVTGCDSNIYPPMSDQLTAAGVDVIDGYDASQLDLNPDLMIVGNVISRGNPVMEAILTGNCLILPDHNGWVNISCKTAGC